MSESSRRGVSVDGAGAAAAVAIASESEGMPPPPPPPYLKLIADCWEHVYDYLSIEDVLAMGQTCNRMNQMSGYYVREYYPNLEFKLCYKKTSKKIYLNEVCVPAHFYQFIRRLSVYDSVYDFSIFVNVAQFDSLKTLVFGSMALDGNAIESIRNVLKNVETIKLYFCEIAPNFYKHLSNYCPQLKHLNVSYSNGKDTHFLTEYYPLLESLTYFVGALLPGNLSFLTKGHELKTFFEKHLKLKSFESDDQFLWANRTRLEQTNIQLDLLHIEYNNLPLTTFGNLLRTLYERGFYKSLQLSSYGFINENDEEQLSDKISELPRLEKLKLESDSCFDLSLVKLKELYIREFDLPVSEELVAKIVPKLERLQFVYVDFNTILLFIRYAKRLRTIEIHCLFGDERFDLVALNEERKLLKNASQVSIYLQDTHYLPIKWQSKNLNLNLMRIERLGFTGFPTF